MRLSMIRSPLATTCVQTCAGRVSPSRRSLGVRERVSYRLYTHDSRAGALNLFGRNPHAFTAEGETLGAMLATQAAIALIADDKQFQFNSALASRDVIGQAKGIIIERFDIDGLQAFELLRKPSSPTPGSSRLPPNSSPEDLTRPQPPERTGTPVCTSNVDHSSPISRRGC